MKWPAAPIIWMAGAATIGIVVAALYLPSLRSNQNPSKVTNISQKMMTVCVGRFTIDLPEDAQVEFAGARVASVDIAAQSGYTEQQLQSDIKELEQGLALKKNEYGQPSLEKKFDVAAINFTSVMMYYGRRKPVSIMEYGQRIPGTEEGISISAFGMKDAVSYIFRGKNLASPRSEDNVLKVAKNFEALAPGQIPTNPGFCVERGLVREPLDADENETVTLFASLPGHPDLAIRLDTTIKTNSAEEPLLARDANSSIKRENASHFKSLRKGPRTINAIPGGEVMDKVKEFNGTSSHAFMWEGAGKVNDVLAPTVTLELQTGQGRPGEPVNSTLSDDEVRQLWERVSSSLKLRATSTEKGGQVATAQKVALGELAATGRTCPQTGFWECKESANVVGGSRKFFRQGENMPPVTLSAAPGLWEKLSGASRSEQLATVWKLVDYEAVADDGIAASTPVGEGGGASTGQAMPDDPDSAIS